jgi:hypothetical protein
VSALTPAELANWLTLYAATGVCASLAAAGAMILVGHEVIRDRKWRALGGFRAKALFVPQLWWRWQKAYLTGTPVILAIVGYYATSLNW